MRLDREYDKPFDRLSAIKYCMEHQRALQDFFSKFRKQDVPRIVAEFLTDEPAVLASILKDNYETSEKEKISDILHTIAVEGTFTMMLGLPGAGKTCSAIWTIEQLFKLGYDNIYWFGFSPALSKAYPKIKQTFNLQGIENGILFYDEVLLTLFGRNAMTSEVKERILNFPYIRHHGMSVVMMSQTEQFDPMLKNMLTYVWFKPFVISGLFEKTMKFKPFIKYLIPHQKNENMLYNLSNNSCSLFTNSLPLRWNDNISKVMSPIKDIKEQREYVELLNEANIRFKDMMAFLNQRNIDVENIKDIVNIPTCPNCNSTNLQRWGFRNNKQRYRCNQCNTVVTDN